MAEKEKRELFGAEGVRVPYQINPLVSRGGRLQSTDFIHNLMIA